MMMIMIKKKRKLHYKQLSLSLKLTSLRTCSELRLFEKVRTTTLSIREKKKVQEQTNNYVLHKLTVFSNDDDDDDDDDDEK